MRPLAKVKPKDEEKTKKTAQRGAANFRSSLRVHHDDDSDNQEGSVTSRYTIVSLRKSTEFFVCTPFLVLA